MEIIYTIGSIVIVSLISLIGILTLFFTNTKIQKIIMYLVSFSAGALFGDVFIHLLPEIIERFGFGLNISLYILSGILFMFIIEKVVQWRHCHQGHCDTHTKPFAITNLIGDAVHNFIDGLIIGASYLVSIPIGIATTLAVLLHEIPQEIGDFGVLVHGGFTKKRALFFNFIIALTAIAGGIIAIILNKYNQNITLFLLPFAAGNFIYIAGSDLIPELHKEIDKKKSFLQLLAFIAGIAIMMLLLFID